MTWKQKELEQSDECIASDATLYVCVETWDNRFDPNWSETPDPIIRLIFNSVKNDSHTSTKIKANFKFTVSSVNLILEVVI